MQSVIRKLIVDFFRDIWKLFDNVLQGVRGLAVQLLEDIAVIIKKKG
jgi:hypothetical protein